MTWLLLLLLLVAATIPVVLSWRRGLRQIKQSADAQRTENLPLVEDVERRYERRFGGTSTDLTEAAARARAAAAARSGDPPKDKP